MEHLLVRAARGEKVERVPVWAMRQAGRWDSEFQKLRTGIGFYDFSENVELAAKASILPVRFGVDGVILFYDITTLPVSMGLPFSLQANTGPVPATPIRTLADVEKLEANPAPQTFEHVRQMLFRVKKDLNNSHPVLVFAGAPFTVATYCIGTGKNMDATRAFARENPAVWDALLEKLSHATVVFLKTLIADGASAYQLFDSWAGMLSENEYDVWAQKYHADILGKATGIPRILFVKECPYLPRQAKTGADIISLGKRHDLAQARKDYPDLVFQGNVDEMILRTGTPEKVREAVRQCLRAGGGHKHILNFNHGVDRTTPMENFAAFVDEARNFKL